MGSTTSSGVPHRQPTSASEDVVTTVNALPFEKFKDTYITPILQQLSLSDEHDFDFQFSSTISQQDLKQCFNLVRDTSSAAYKASSRGWSARDKRAEMRDADMRYMMIKIGSKRPLASPERTNADVPENTIPAFVSFMLTWEDELQVLYCYEVHVQPAMQSKGLGSSLMRGMMLIGNAVGVEKVMLTVFTSNTSAIRLYARLGYDLYDEEPPPPRKKLRGGLTEQPKPSYVIMAKSLQ